MLPILEETPSKSPQSVFQLGLGCQHLALQRSLITTGICERFIELQQNFKRMTALKMTADKLETYLGNVFPDPQRGTQRYEQAVKQALSDRKRSRELFETGRGNALPKVAGSLWAAYNGVVEYVDFRRSVVGDSKWLETIWFGTGSKIKTDAFEAAMNIVGMN